MWRFEEKLEKCFEKYENPIFPPKFLAIYTIGLFRQFWKVQFFQKAFLNASMLDTFCVHLHV